MSLASLLVCHKIAAARYFVWHLGLQKWSGSEAKFKVSMIKKKFNIQLSENVFLNIQCTGFAIFWMVF